MYNAFLIPYNCKNVRKELIQNSQEPRIIEYVGYAKSDWRENDKNHEIVHVFLIDLSYVIHTWNKSDHEEDVDNLIKQIENQQKRYKEIELLKTLFGERAISKEEYERRLQDLIQKQVED